MVPFWSISEYFLSLKRKQVYGNQTCQWFHSEKNFDNKHRMEKLNLESNEVWSHACNVEEGEARGWRGCLKSLTEANDNKSTTPTCISDASRYKNQMAFSTLPF